MPKLTEITLESLAGGAAEVKFQHEWGRVLKNTQDPNTDATKARTVTLVITLHPAEDREEGEVEVKASAKLAPHKPERRRVFMGRKGDELVAVHYDPRQEDMFKEDEVAGVDEDVVPISSRTGTEGGT